MRKNIAGITEDFIFTDEEKSLMNANAISHHCQI
jgi:hypothetical protein